jgi:hypothetical protein
MNASLNLHYFRCNWCGTIWSCPRGSSGPIRVIAKPLTAENLPDPDYA